MVHGRLNVSSKNKFLGTSSPERDAQLNLRPGKSSTTTQRLNQLRTLLSACSTCGVEVVFLLGTVAHSCLTKQNLSLPPNYQ
jgi:hypothetical protein